jgi:hypothetical protein
MPRFDDAINIATNELSAKLLAAKVHFQAHDVKDHAM